MPELPEVTTTASILNRLLPGLKISSVWTDYNSPFHKGKDNIKNPPYFEKFKRNVTGKKIISVSRRGKNVLIELSEGISLLIHMKMTGHLLYGTYKTNPNSPNYLIPNKITNSQKLKDQKIQKLKIKNSHWVNEIWTPNEPSMSPLWDPFNRFIHFVICFENGKCLVLSDVRKFAKVIYFNTKEIDDIPDIKKLGPEPLEKSFTFKKLKERILKRPERPIKQTLMMPEIIAGIGNIYSDEMLWASGIHPLSKPKNIPDKDFKKLYKEMVSVLKKGIDFKGDSTSDYRTPSGERGQFQHQHKAYRNTGKPCAKPKCKGVISRIKVGGRSAHFCPRHQIKF